MKITLIAAVLTMASCVGVYAQDAAVWKQHRHSLEISTGIPYPMITHSDAGPEPGSQEELEFLSRWDNGLSLKKTMYPNLTVTYSFRFANNGEVSVFFNVHGYTHA